MELQLTKPICFFDLETTGVNIATDRIVEISGIVFAMIFIIEFLLRIIAQGFFIHKKSYMREGWNILDFCIVLISIIELF